MAKVSILLSVYNAEKYLRECLDSVRQQDFTDFELLCYNDGSTDGSAAVLAEYAERDGRIRVTGSENRGPSHARNELFKQVSAEYVMYIDADDRYVPHTVRTAYQRITETQADVTVFNAWDFDDETGKLYNHQYLAKNILPKGADCFNLKDKLPEDVFRFTSPVCWNKIYTRKLLSDPRIYFPEDVRHYEDQYFATAVFLLADRITWVDKRLYRYRRQTANSLKNVLRDQEHDLTDAFVSAKEKLKETGLLQDPRIEQSLNRKALGISRYNMEFCSDYQIYENMFRYLEEEGLERLGIGEVEDTYFFDEEDAAFYHHIKQGKADEYLLRRYKQIHTKLIQEEWLKKDFEAKYKAAKKKLEAAEKELQQYKEKL